MMTLTGIINMIIRYQNSSKGKIRTFIKDFLIKRFIKKMNKYLSYKDLDANTLITMCYICSLFNIEKIDSPSYKYTFKVLDAVKKQFYIYITDNLNVIRINIDGNSSIQSNIIEFDFKCEQYSYIATYHNRLDKNVKFRIDSLVWNGCINTLKYVLQQNCELKYPIYNQYSEREDDDENDQSSEFFR